MNKHLEKLWENFDKLLLGFLIVVLVFVHYHMMSAAGNVVDPAEGAQINWLEGIIGQVLAALLTLLVTQHRKPNDAQPDKPAAADNKG